jgi:hypothetical protein
MSNPKHGYAGVDWGSQSHCVFLTDDQGRKRGQRFFKHSGEGLAEMADWLLKTSGAEEAGQILVAIEVPHGPVVEALIERGFAPSMRSTRSRWIVSATVSPWREPRTTVATRR